MKVKVKICGIRSLESALVASNEGAEFIGFNFVPSAGRYIDPEKSLKIINQIRGKIKIVGVFRNADIREVKSIAQKLNLDYIQLHGNEDDTYIKQLHYPVIKSINRMQKITPIYAQFLLVDRKIQGKGKMVDYTYAKDLAEKNAIFFAGGLTPDNIAIAIEKVKPFAVDVASGIETNGREDLQKIKQFIINAKGVEI